jgi:hypothetical protein
MLVITCGLSLGATKRFEGGIWLHPLLRGGGRSSLWPRRSVHLGASVLEGTVGRLIDPLIGMGTHPRASVDRRLLVFRVTNAGRTVPVIRSVPTSPSPNSVVHAAATSGVILFSGVRVTRPGTCSSSVITSGDSGGWLRQGTRFVIKGFARVGIGVSVYASDARFGFHATTVSHGGVTRFALGRARLGHIVHRFKCSAAKILADAVDGLEGAPMTH